jgi:hypothetical protein
MDDALGYNMTLSFADMPSWVIVAVISRIARQVQGAAAWLSQEDRDAVNKAIQVAERSAQEGHVGERALELAENAKRASEHARNTNQPKAVHAAICASEAAVAAHCAMNKQELIHAAERALAVAQRAIKPECLSDFEADIGEIAQLGQRLSDSDPAPAAMLDWVHYQAVHEAGHAIVASYLRILFERVRVIYEAGMRFIPNSIDDPEEVVTADKRKYLLGYAAGAAAEDLVFGRRREAGCVQDRQEYERSGGTDFDGDAAKVREYDWFSEPSLIKIASLLEERHELSDREVRQALNLPSLWREYHG